MINISTIVVFLYGLFALVGGMIGYVKAKSKASLIAGSVSGIILIGCAYGFTQGVRGAYWISLVVAIVLGVRFLKKWFVTKRVMPELLMVIFSALTLFFVGLRMMAGLSS
ncbi:MAG: TMEM14 family protein [Candidatus Omnitrophica bacterium]|nr:TMEM14 family protein [Candidatus Omnitrophota bacterium]